MTPPNEEGKGTKPPPLEEEDGPTRMSEPDGDLLAMLQRARAVDESQPDVPRRRRGKTNAVAIGPGEEDVPTLVRTDISVDELEVRAQAEAESPAETEEVRASAHPPITETPQPVATPPRSGAILGAPPRIRPTPRLLGSGNRRAVLVLGMLLGLLALLAIALWFAGVDGERLLALLRELRL